MAFLASAVGMLGYSGFSIADTWIFQQQGSKAFAPHLRLAAPPGPGVAEVGGLVGRMEIARLGLSVVVAEGTEEGTLRHAAGHILGTGLPGTAGNVGIAAHRDTLFRPLRDIRKNDVIVLTTLQSEYSYRVISTKIVDPSDVAVLNPDGHEILTLVTCYPFYFIGPAPHRFIVRAERTNVGI